MTKVTKYKNIFHWNEILENVLSKLTGTFTKSMLWTKFSKMNIKQIIFCVKLFDIQKESHILNYLKWLWIHIFNKKNYFWKQFVKISKWSCSIHETTVLITMKLLHLNKYMNNVINKIFIKIYEKRIIYYIKSRINETVFGNLENVASILKWSFMFSCVEYH